MVRLSRHNLGGRLAPPRHEHHPKSPSEVSHANWWFSHCRIWNVLWIKVNPFWGYASAEWQCFYSQLRGSHNYFCQGPEPSRRAKQHYLSTNLSVSLCSPSLSLLFSQRAVQRASVVWKKKKTRKRWVIFSFRKKIQWGFRVENNQTKCK